MVGFIRNLRRLQIDYALKSARQSAGAPAVRVFLLRLLFSSQIRKGFLHIRIGWVRFRIWFKNRAAFGTAVAWKSVQVIAAVLAASGRAKCVGAKAKPRQWAKHQRN